MPTQLETSSPQRSQRRTATAVARGWPTAVIAAALLATGWL